MRKEIEIGGRKFLQKTQAALFFRQILKETEPGTFLSGEQEVFLRAALLLHWDYHGRFEGKAFCIGVEFAPLTRERSRRFFVEYEDGKRDSFSWLKLLTPDNHEDRVRQALRGAISSQVRAVMDNAFAQARVTACEITGREITREAACVDHAYPRTFSALVVKWMERRGLTYDRLSVEATESEIHQWRLCDRATEQDWQDFHARWSRLRIVESQINSALSNRPETTLSEVP